MKFSEIKSAALADWGPPIERFARLMAVAIAATYAAGYVAGRTLHRWSDWLAPRYAAWVTGEPMAQPAPAPVRPIVQRQAAAVAAPANVAPPQLIESVPPFFSDGPRHTVADLRRMARAAGHRSLARSGRRAELLAALGMNE